MAEEGKDAIARMQMSRRSRSSLLAARQRAQRGLHTSQHSHMARRTSQRRFTISREALPACRATSAEIRRPFLSLQASLQPEGSTNLADSERCPILERET